MTDAYFPHDTVRVGRGEQKTEHPSSSVSSDITQGNPAELLRTVFYGDVPSKQALDVLTAPLPGHTGLFGVDAELLRPTRGRAYLNEMDEPDKPDLLLWAGWAKEGEPGSFFIPAPYSREYVEQVAQRTYSDLRHKIRVKHLGLQDKGIPWLVTSPIEIDHLPLDEQAALYAEFEAKTGYRFALLTLSGDTRPESIVAARAEPSLVVGGKSMHAYPVFDRRLEAAKGCSDRELFNRIVNAQIAMFAGDTAINNPGRLMRTPGVVARTPYGEDERVRIQPILRADTSARTSPEDYLDAVLYYGKRIGIEGDEAIERTVEVYRLAERCEQRIRSDKVQTTESAAAELSEVARALRAARFEADEATIQGAHRLLRDTGGGSTTSLCNKEPGAGALLAPRASIRRGNAQAEEIPTSTIVTAQGGRSMPIETWATNGAILDAGIRCQCPRCEQEGKIDARGASMVHGGGRPHIHCFRGHSLRMTPSGAVDTFSVGRHDPGSLVFDGVVAGEGGSTTSLREKEHGGGAPQGEKTLEAHQRFLDLDNSAWHSALVVAIKSAISTGKTTAIEKAFRNVPILIIAHRRALCRSLARRFKAVNYEKKGIDWTDPPERLVICLDSLPKLMRGLVHFTPDGEVVHRRFAVIMDESESLFRHLHGRTLKSKHLAGRVWECLSSVLVHNADRIVLADGHLSDFSTDVVKLLMTPLSPMILHVCNTWTVSESVGTKRAIVNYDDPADLRSYLVDKVERDTAYRPWISCDTRADAEEIHARLVKIHPKGRWLLVTARTLLDPDVKKVLEAVNDPGHGFAAYDGVVASPAIDSGVDYNRDVGDGAFDEVLLFAQGGRHTWKDLVQMVGRPRSLVARTIRAYVSSYSLGRPTALWQLRDDARTVARLAATYAGRWVGEIGHRKAWQPMDSRMADSDLRAELQINVDGSFLQAKWNDYWTGQGCEVTEAEVLSPEQRKLIKAETQQTKTNNKVMECKATAASPDIPIDDALLIDRTEAADVDEERAARKALTADFYGIEPNELTARHIWTDDCRRLQGKARSVGHAHILSRGDKRAVMRGDHRELQEMWEAEHDHHGLRTAYRYAVLKAAGIEHIFELADRRIAANKERGAVPSPTTILRGPKGASSERKTTGIVPAALGADVDEIEIELPESFAQNMKSLEAPLRRLLGINVSSYLSPQGKRRPNPKGIVTKVLRQMGIAVASSRRNSEPRRHYVNVGQVAGMLVLSDRWEERYMERVSAVGLPKPVVEVETLEELHIEDLLADFDQAKGAA